MKNTKGKEKIQNIDLLYVFFTFVRFVLFYGNGESYENNSSFDLPQN